MNWQKFFKEHGNSSLQCLSAFVSDSIKIEDLYQAFKARLVKEISDQEQDKTKMVEVRQDDLKFMLDCIVYEELFEFEASALERLKRATEYEENR